MKSLLALAAVGVLLCGCTTIENAIGASATSTMRKSIQAGLLTYKDVYQPAVLAYGALPACPQQAPVCKDPAVLARLKAADAAAVKAINDARTIVYGAEGDPDDKLGALQTAIQDAELLIAKAGALSIVKAN